MLGRPVLCDWLSDGFCVILAPTHFLDIALVVSYIVPGPRFAYTNIPNTMYISGICSLMRDEGLHCLKLIGHRKESYHT